MDLRPTFITVATRNRIAIVSVVVLSLLSAASADADVPLRLEPSLQTLAPGQAGAISVILDLPEAVRTIDITLRGDPDRILDMVAVPGDMFADVPCMIWEESEILEPGVWHGFAVIIGSTCQATGPGELLRWTFTGGEAGGSIVDSVDVALYDPAGDRFPDVTCSHAVVLVSQDTATSPTPMRPVMTIHPNPFNPATTITVDLDRGADAVLTVFDPKGRRVDTPWSGDLPAGRSVVEWRGVDAAGRPQPSGCYLFHLSVAGEEPTLIRASLLR